MRRALTPTLRLRRVVREAGEPDGARMWRVTFRSHVIEQVIQQFWQDDTGGGEWVDIPLVCEPFRD